MKEKDNLEIPGSDGRLWTGLIWLRTGTDGELLRIR